MKKDLIKINKKGFTLVETLVAISILLIAITGVMTAIQIGLSSATFAQNQTTAYFLAAEAVDYIHNIRDNNVGKTGDWLAGLDASCYTAGQACKLEVYGASPTTRCDPTNPTDCLLYFDSTGANGFYKTSGAVASQFSRSITISRLKVDPGVGITVPTNGEGNITVTVSWKANNGQTRSVILTDTIYEISSN
jgi:prepilin-type N-terminal cleavage/methylation domain-containing protein